MLQLSYEIKTYCQKFVNKLDCHCLFFWYRYFFGDYWLGPITLASGILNAYYMAIGRWENYIYGLIFTVFYGSVSFANGLYGMAIFTVLVYFPMQIFGIVNWIKNKKEEKVEMKSLNFKKATILCGIIVAGSFFLGFLLSLIPTQNLAFMDSSSQIINIAGILLVTFRYRESWYVWLVNNTIDLAIWIINVIGNTKNSQMMLVVSVMYLISNIIGIICWVKIEKKQKMLTGKTGEI